MTRRAGFTLLELLAVIVILGVASTLVLPSLGVTASARVREDARDLAGGIELARQRTVMTGIPHRVQLDLEGGRWWVEWQLQQEAEADAAPEDAFGRGGVDLSPPPGPNADWERLPSAFGASQALRNGSFFRGVELGYTTVERGLYPLEFAFDGSAEPARIRVEEVGGYALVLVVRALVDAVEVEDA